MERERKSGGGREGGRESERWIADLDIEIIEVTLLDETLPA